MKGCMRCLRLILLILNTFEAVIGLGILGISVYFFMEPAAQDILQASGYYRTAQSILYVLMGIGGLILVISLFGWCGAWHESQCLLTTYFSFLLVILALQITGATLGYVYREELMKYVDDRLQEGVEEYSILRDQRENPVAFMDSLQRMLMCCGSNGYQDYRDRIPLACCDRSISNCPEAIIKEHEVYSEGCKEKYKSLLSTHLVTIFLGTVSIAAFEIFCILFATIMCCYIRQYRADYYGVDYAVAT